MGEAVITIIIRGYLVNAGKILRRLIDDDGFEAAHGFQIIMNLQGETLES
jgi:hypothetical protein